MEVVNIISREDQKLPIDVAKDVQLTYSDSGRVKVLLSSSIMENYGGNNPHVEMPEGLHVQFYNNAGARESVLTANYAISYENTQIMEAKNDVVYVNTKGEKLNTEHLVWKQKEGKVISHAFVRITTDDRVIYGDSLEADENMENWVIKNPRGVIYLDDEFRDNNQDNSLNER